MQFTDTSILVTGATGLVGSRVTSRLAALGARVRALLADLRERGLDTEASMFVALDGAKALLVAEAGFRRVNPNSVGAIRVMNLSTQPIFNYRRGMPPDQH